MSNNLSVQKTNSTIDILKVIMALLVVGIHTEPFGFNVWLDRGFGIITRLCVPFFFITSAYFYWLKEKGAILYLKRIVLLYLIWSVIYLPFDIKELSSMSFGQILYRFLWEGNEHALWYLCASAVGFIITFLLLKILKPKAVLIIGILFLVIGCVKSTWAPLAEKLFSVNIPDFLGSRNGLFYAFPYTALGMYIAKKPDKGKTENLLPAIIGFIASLAALAAESFVFVVWLKTPVTILWLSVLPCTYFLFILSSNIKINLRKDTSLFLRKMSTLIYVSQYLFIPLFKNFNYMGLFILVSVSAVIFSAVIIKLSETKYLKPLKYLY